MKIAKTSSATPPEGVTVDCTSGQVVCTPLTPDQIAAQQAAASQAVAQQQAAAAARQQLIATVAADTTPAIQALGKLLGLIP